MNKDADGNLDGGVPAEGHKPNDDGDGGSAGMPNLPILLKKACEHRDCPYTRCAKGLRIGGFEI